jgi:hypothetical protein
MLVLDSKYSPKSVECTCEQCSSKFMSRPVDVRRGRSRFCGISCARTFLNLRHSAQNEKVHICRCCGAEFTTSQPSKFCSLQCKNKFNASKRGYNSRCVVFKDIAKLPCEICGWEESTRDVHHIIPVANGGENTQINLISLCPNHHRLAHKKILSEQRLRDAVSNRTISSSAEAESGANAVIK